MTSEPGIRFEYRPSRLPLYLASSGLCLVLLALFAADIPLILQFSIAIAALVLAFYRQRRAADRAVRRVQWASDGTWTVDLATGHEVAMELDTFRTFGSHIVLNLRSGDAVGPILWLAGDNTDEATRRRLRMRLAKAASAELPETLPDPSSWRTPGSSALRSNVRKTLGPGVRRGDDGK
ncbi:protein YgfX [Dyella sp. GSA-30]|uniref:protein YgfX n=1 Tax=Dyella sp. GSA-30 TaxID=2994496 RepID=UPI00248F59BB|nr:protein YgfX [Dyella sp. GSA-30]BDU21218.1 hypothetical protein DYGSA30_26750 [Dyella sp. GSA-30]